jgi:hypothetical protein
MSALHSPCSAASADWARLPESATGRTYFFVTGEAECGLLPRLLQSFAKLSLTPYRVHASTEQGAGEEMTVELRIQGNDPALAERLAALCRAVIGVRSVIMVMEH